MLKKLLKYDLKYMIKNMLIFYVLSIFSSILTRIFFSLNQTTFINVIGQICVGVMFSMIFSMIFNTIIRSWVRFKMSLYGDESYLYHTLPVTRKQLIESKFLESIVFTLIGFSCSLISLLIAYASKENFELIKNSFLNISSALDINIYLFLVIIALLLFIEIINTVQSGFIGIIIGNKKFERRTLYSFVYGIIFFILTQIITVIFILFIGIFDSNIMSIFTSNEHISSQTFVVLCILSIIVYLLIVALYNFMSIKSFENKINIE